MAGESKEQLTDNDAQYVRPLASRVPSRWVEPSQAEFGRILEFSLNEIYVFDAESHRFLLVNRGARANLGYSMSELRQLTPLDIKPQFTTQSLEEVIRPLREGEREIIDFETVHRRKDGSHYPVEVHLQLSNFRGLPAYVAIILDITRRLRTEKELEGRKRTLELLASGASLKVVMEKLIEGAEALVPGMIGSVLTLDRETNRISQAYAIGLPDFYNEAIVGLSIGQGVGSCGTAAYTGQRVIVEDVMTHAYWANYRELAEKAGLRACWSEPIISANGKVLGTFAMYYREPRSPDDYEIKLIHTTAYIAALAIEQRQNELAIQNAHISLEKRVQERTAELESDRHLLRRLIDLQEQERRIVAHDIHDGFVQDVVGAHFRVQSIHSGIGQDELQKNIDEVASLLSRAIADGRRMIGDLRPMVLDEQGIVEAIRHLIADEAKHGNFVVAFDHDVRFRRLEARLEGVIFRIVQEALNNTKRHGQTDHAFVMLKQENGMLKVVVRDQGIGFDPNTVTTENFGLRGIRERARLFGGTARIESVLGGGTTVYAELPIVEASSVVTE